MAHKPPIMVKDDGDKLAVLANGKAATKWLGLENPSETKVSHLEVVNPETGEILFEDTVGEGKYFSAIWIQYQVHMSGADSLDVLYFNDVRKKHLKKYMGEIVIADAENPELENHAFVRALLSTDTVLHINITWKIKKDTKTMVFTRQSEITDSLTPVIEAAWENRADLSPESTGEYREAVEEAIHHLDDGTLRVASKQGKDWIVHQWLKKAVLLGFRLSPNDTMSGGPDGTMFFDKVESKFAGWDEERFEKAGFRVVPPAAVRRGSFIGKNAVIMPSYVNIGAYVGPGTMVDTWATVGSCAQIGENCHLSGGVGIGGVLEPLQANPTIIEDNCFIGARSEVVEGVIVREGSVLAMGVFLSQSTKILDRATGEITFGEVPAYSVVVPGSLPSKDGSHSLSCAVIVKTVDEQTRSKTAVNELLRD